MSTNDSLPANPPIASDVGGDAKTSSKMFASTKARSHWGAGILLCGFLLLGNFQLADIGTTVDEPFHLIRGLTVHWSGETRNSYAHPPLANALMTWPAALVQGDYPYAELEGWDVADPAPMADQYMGEGYGHFKKQLLLSRRTALLVAALIGLYIYGWLFSFLGWPWALVGLAAYLFNPTFLAHARLVTTDAPLAGLALVCVAELARYLKGSGKIPWRFGLALGLALSIKHSALLLIPFCAAVGLVAALLRHGRFAEQPWWRLPVDFLVVGTIALTILNGAYGFQNTFLSAGEILEEVVPTNHITLRHQQGFVSKFTPIDDLPSWLPVPVPYSYIVGVASIRAHNQQGHLSYFDGQLSRRGWRSYFPVMIFAKTPTILWCVLLAGLVAWSRKRSPPRMETMLLIAMAAFFLSFAVFSQINIGVRHVLPVMAALSVLTGCAAQEAARGFSTTGTRAALAATLVVAITIGTAWLQHPWHLGYFNLMVGGSKGGHKLSIVGEDWAQDVPALAAYIKEKGLPAPYYEVYSRAAPYEMQLQKVPYRPMKCETSIRQGWAVVHAAAWARKRQRCYPWARRATLRHVINHHILIFTVSPPGAVRGRRSG